MTWPDPPARRAPRLVALAGLGVLAVLAYPFAIERVLHAVGTRGAGAAVLAVGVASILLLGRIHPVPTRATAARVGLLALPALGVATDSDAWLRLVPASILAMVALAFVLSLRGGGSLFEDAARLIQPLAPDFIRPYCRKATLAFAALFVVQAVALTLLALAESRPGWAAASSALVWLPLGPAFAIEWIVRKAWFRHYGPNPVDRLLRVVMPPERTAQGRRSLEHRRRVGREPGLPPP